MNAILFQGSHYDSNRPSYTEDHIQLAISLMNQKETESKYTCYVTVN